MKGGGRKRRRNNNTNTNNNTTTTPIPFSPNRYRYYRCSSNNRNTTTTTTTNTNRNNTHTTTIACTHADTHTHTYIHTYVYYYCYCTPLCSGSTPLRLSGIVDTIRHAWRSHREIWDTETTAHPIITESSSLSTTPTRHTERWEEPQPVKRQGAARAPPAVQAAAS